MRKWFLLTDYNNQEHIIPHDIIGALSLETINQWDIAQGKKQLGEVGWQ